MRKTTSVNYRNEAELIASCPLAAAMKLIGGRWKIMLLWYVHHGIDRFSDFKRVVPHISEKVLYQQLREMERDLLLLRLVHGRSVTYRLTDLGKSLVPVLAGLAEWAAQHGVSRRLSAFMTQASDASNQAQAIDR
jgi:DNA-binding HxlR family transcriptional regulator